MTVIQIIEEMMSELQSLNYDEKKGRSVNVAALKAQLRRANAFAKENPLLALHSSLPDIETDDTEQVDSQWEEDKLEALASLKIMHDTARQEQERMENLEKRMRAEERARGKISNNRGL